MDIQALLPDARAIARQAGQVILEIYKSDDYEHCDKSDDTPVTTADYASNDVLIEALQQLAPEIPIISEETTAVNLSTRRNWPYYWLLDPMDGTQEFIAKSGDFAVSMALVADGWPVMGVIYWPEKDITYFASEGHGAFKQLPDGTIERIRIDPYDGSRPIRMAISRRQKQSTVMQYFMDHIKVDMVPLGSCSLKSCIIAEGIADCYLRVGPTGEWDTGAVHCIIEEAGGRILDSQFNSLSYNQRETFENPDFMVLGDQNIDWRNIIKPHRTSR